MKKKLAIFLHQLIDNFVCESPIHLSRVKELERVYYGQMSIIYELECHLKKWEMDCISARKQLEELN
jgi:hypothetical protein